MELLHNLIYNNDVQRRNTSGNRKRNATGMESLEFDKGAAFNLGNSLYRKYRFIGNISLALEDQVKT